MKKKLDIDSRVQIDIDIDMGLAIIVSILQLVLIVGKLVGLFNISWPVVFIPLFGTIIFFLLVLMFAMMIQMTEELPDDREE